MPLLTSPGKLPSCPGNRLSGVLGGTGTPPFVVQDLRPGERQPFASEAALRRLLATRVEPMRRR